MSFVAGSPGGDRFSHDPAEQGTCHGRQPPRWRVEPIRPLRKRARKAICSERKKNGYTAGSAMRGAGHSLAQKKRAAKRWGPERRYCGEKDVIAMGEISRRCVSEQAACHAQ